MRILITGVTGFVGRHLVEALSAGGEAALFGVSRSGSWPSGSENLRQKAALQSLDLTNRAAIRNALAEIRPEWIFHLAGYPHPRQSLTERDQAWAGNLDATRNLCESVIDWGGSPRILTVSSGLIYGDSDGRDARCDEDAAMRPASPYAASKAAADLAAFQYTRHPGLDIVRVRPLNHVGPGQSKDYAIPRFASQIAEIERGQKPPVIETGDLSAVRDFTDVRDMVRAYILLLEKGRCGEAYNAASGTEWCMRDVVEKLQSLSSVRAEVRSKVAARSNESVTARLDTSKLRQDTGWKPTIPFDETLRDTLDYWRRQSK
jgi:GDP-4-dehydro-6-deoxy-D-mannose reductase